MNEKDKLKRKLETSYFAIAVLVGIVLLLLASLYFCKTAKAEERNYLSVGLGNTQFKQNDLGSGTWHQAPEYGTHFMSDSPARRVIVGRQVFPWLGVEGGIHDFGKSDIFGTWISDAGYQSGNIGNEPVDVGFTTVRLRGYSFGANLSTKFIFDWFLRAHIIKYEWDFQYYNHSGSAPKEPEIGTGKCRVRGINPMYSVGVRFGNFTIEQTRLSVQHARSSDACTSNFTSAKTVFVGYEWRF